MTRAEVEPGTLPTLGLDDGGDGFRKRGVGALGVVLWDDDNDVGTSTGGRHAFWFSLLDLDVPVYNSIFPVLCWLGTGAVLVVRVWREEKSVECAGPDRYHALPMN
jgi:hypothetical protein